MKANKRITKNRIIQQRYANTPQRCRNTNSSNYFGTQLFFLGCNRDNNHGSNFMIKKKICLVLPEKEISNHRN